MCGCEMYDGQHQQPALATVSYRTMSSQTSRGRSVVADLVNRILDDWTAGREVEAREELQFLQPDMHDIVLSTLLNRVEQMEARLRLRGLPLPRVTPPLHGQSPIQAAAEVLLKSYTALVESLQGYPNRAVWEDLVRP